ncbi:hypothetical protein FRC09_001514 [Ceratobasidium sp. 395]|nr:hypothetical protein FRC09_001514 [Ceratobasidium sp. 395]
MQTCPNATGIGISLPYEQGGHGLAISSELLSRIQVHISDLAQFDLAPVIPKPNSTLASALATIPFRPHTFDLVVCDGHHLRLNPDNADRPWNWNRLLVSQLLLGLRAVSSGGTLFLKLSHPEKPMGARILLALCRIAHPVRTIKPTMHATRGTLYVIAQHIRLDTEEYHALERALEKLWYTMSFEGENGYGREISSEEEDTITSWEDVMSTEGQNNVVRLSAKVWHIQRNALSKLLRSRSVSNHQG